MLPRDWKYGRVWKLNLHTPKWTPTLGVGVPMDSSSENNCRGQNPSYYRVPYIIGKFLELRCLKWARMTQLDIWNTSYGQKKNRESNCQIDSRPLKVRNHPDFHVCRWRATYCWKALDEGYNVSSNLILIRSLHTKLRTLKVGILGLPLRSPETKCHLDVGPTANHRVYYKGEGDGFPQVWILMSLVSSS
jgi:hypothetical protein